MHGSKERVRGGPAPAGYEGEVGICHGLEGHFAASAFAVQIHDREAAKKVLEIERQRSGVVSGAKPHMAGQMWDLAAQAWLRYSRPALRLSWSRLIVDLTGLTVHGTSPS